MLRKKKEAHTGPGENGQFEYPGRSNLIELRLHVELEDEDAMVLFDPRNPV